MCTCECAVLCTSLYICMCEFMCSHVQSRVKITSRGVKLSSSSLLLSSLSLLVIKRYSVALQATSHGLSHRNQPLGDGVYGCVSVLLVCNGHLFHNNVTHIYQEQNAPLLSILPFLSLSLHFFSYHFSICLPSSIKKKRKSVCVRVRLRERQ